MTACQNFFERALQDAPAVAKPVVPIAERLHSSGAREFRLLFPHLGHAQVVEPEISR